MKPAIIAAIAVAVIIPMIVIPFSYKPAYDQNCTSDGGMVTGFLQCTYVFKDFGPETFDYEIINGNVTYGSQYEIAGGIVEKISYDADANSLIISINDSDTGYILVVLPSGLLSPGNTAPLADYLVIQNGEEVSFERLSPIILKIPFEKNTKKIEIVGITKTNENEQEESSYELDEPICIGKNCKIAGSTDSGCMSIEQSRNTASFFKVPSYLPEKYSYSCAVSGTPTESYMIFDRKEISSQWMGDLAHLISDGAIFIHQTDMKKILGEKEFFELGTPEEQIQETYDDVKENNPSLNPMLIRINGMLAYAVESCPDCAIQSANFTDGAIISESQTESRIKFIDGIGISYMLKSSLPLEELVKVAESLDKEQKNPEGFQVRVTGAQQVRGGTTHDINVAVTRDGSPVENAQIRITIEDYGEDILREFKARTDSDGRFVFSWEAPKFDNIKALLAFIDATDDISAKTILFKFSVYCLPGEAGCKIKGN